MTQTGLPSRRDRTVVAGGVAGLVAGAVLLAPWLRPGALLVRDLVAVPDPAWPGRLLVTSSRLPRDVPGEALVAIVGQVVPADLVVRVLLLTAFATLGAGVASLLGGGRTAAIVAATLAVWNPWVWARLHQGQWLVVVALAGVPWVARRVADDDRWRLARVMVLTGATGFAATVVVVPTLVAVAVPMRRWAALGVGLGTATVMALPWLVVAGPVVGDPDGFVAFAPSADLAAGAQASVLAAGGYFNRAIASPWRGTVVVTVVALVLVAAAIVGALLWRTAVPTPVERRLRTALLAVGSGVALAVLVTTLPGVPGWLGDRAAASPWLAVLRDGHRLLGPWVVVLALGLGHLVARAHDRMPAIPDVQAVATPLLALALVVTALPDPLIGPRVPAPTDLPTSWDRAAAVIDDDPRPGAVLVVPHGQTQAYPFTDHRPVAVPLRRTLAREVLVDSRLTVLESSGQLLAVDDTTEGQRLRWLAARDLAGVSGRTLAAEGVGWVAITDPAHFVEVPGDDVTVAMRAAELQVLAVDQDAAPVATPAPARWPLVVDLLVAGVAIALLVAGRRRRPVPSVTRPHVSARGCSLAPRRSAPCSDIVRSGPSSS